MKITQTRDWLLLSVLTFSGLVTFVIFYLLADRFIPPAEDVHDYYAGVVHFLEDTAGNQPEGVFGESSPVRIGGVLTLKLGEAVKMGEALLVYRGLQDGGLFEVDVVIPSFDRQRPFSYRLNVQEAQKGFRLANRTFELLSATRTVLHLQTIGE